MYVRCSPNQRPRGKNLRLCSWFNNYLHYLLFTYLAGLSRFFTTEQRIFEKWKHNIIFRYLFWLFSFFRNEIFVTSKLWNEYHKTEDVEAACRKSLSNLGLQNLDLYLMHWPFAFERQHPKGIYPVDFTYQVV